MAASELETVLNGLKEQGIGSALVSSDGKILAATMALDDISTSNLVSFSNTCDSLLKRNEDMQKEIEINFQNGKLVIIPLDKSYLCAIVTRIEDKSKVRDCATSLSKILQGGA